MKKKMILERTQKKGTEIRPLANYFRNELFPCFRQFIAVIQDRHGDHQAGANAGQEDLGERYIDQYENNVGEITDPEFDEPFGIAHPARPRCNEIRDEETQQVTTDLAVDVSIRIKGHEPNNGHLQQVQGQQKDPVDDDLRDRFLFDQFHKLKV